MRWLLVLALSGCGTTMFAKPADLEDYRAFRVAAADGTRLRRAQTYLERHPKGQFATEVREVFETEEPRFFATAQESREGVRRYLADLPRGPHAEAALALLVAYRSDMKDAELADIARRARADDARLEAAAVQRRAVGEAILGAVGALLEDDAYGAPPEETSLRRLLVGPATWGGISARRETDYFFVLPTRPQRQSRLLTLEVEAILDGPNAVAGVVAGADLFVRWAEADQIAALDATPEDRTEAQIHVMTRLGGALERRFPSASCKDAAEGAELYHRACDGWEVVVRAGARPGERDAILVTSPRAPRGRRTAKPR